MLLRLLPQTSLLLCFCSRVLSRGLCRSGRSSTSVPFSSISWPCPLLRQPKALIMTDDCSLSNLFPPFLFRSSALEGCLPYRSLCSHNGSTRAACSAQCFQRRSCHEAQCLIPLGRQALCLSSFPTPNANHKPSFCVRATASLIRIYVFRLILPATSLYV